MGWCPPPPTFIALSFLLHWFQYREDKSSVTSPLMWGEIHFPVIQYTELCFFFFFFVFVCSLSLVCLDKWVCLVADGHSDWTRAQTHTHKHTSTHFRSVWPCLLEAPAVACEQVRSANKLSGSTEFAFILLSLSSLSLSLLLFSFPLFTPNQVQQFTKLWAKNMLQITAKC